MRNSHLVLMTQVGLNGNASIDLDLALVAAKKVKFKQWGYLMDEDVTCECGSEPQTMDHLHEMSSPGAGMFGCKSC